MTARRIPPKPAQTKQQEIPADHELANEPLPDAPIELAEGDPVVTGVPLEFDLRTYDTFAVLNDGGQNFLDGPVPVRPVRFAGSLMMWLATGGCPWADLDGEHVVLTLANIVLEFTIGDTLDDGSVVLTPGAHLWTEDAAWLLASDGTETAVPRRG